MNSEKAMAPHSSTLAWKIPWMEEPGRLQSKGSLRVGHDWVTSVSFFAFMHWRRKWQPAPVFLPGESQGLGSLPSMGSQRVGRDWSDLAAAAVLWITVLADTWSAAFQLERQPQALLCRNPEPPLRVGRQSSVVTESQNRALPTPSSLNTGS